MHILAGLALAAVPSRAKLVIRAVGTGFGFAVAVDCSLAVKGGAVRLIVAAVILVHPEGVDRVVVYDDADQFGGNRRSVLVLAGDFKGKSGF